VKSFRPGFIESQPISQTLLQTIRTIGEYKGQERLYQQQSPQLLEALRDAAVIESTESSNRLEGITAPRERLVQLAENRATPRDRPEQEIAGYRDVLATIHANHAGMNFNQGLVRQLHRDLFQYTTSPGGEWKITDNQITERHPDGTIAVRFGPVPAFRTAEAMESLHAGFVTAWGGGQIEPLLVLSAYVFDFLCVHPFLDGNGRLSRLVTLLLLYQAGYGVGRFISLEKAVEQTREGYYEALGKSSQGWHEGTHTLVPWWEYLLGVVVLTVYREFEARAGTITTGRGSQSKLVIQAVERLPMPFKIRDIERMAPGVSRPTINRVLQSLRRQGEIRLLSKGRDASWERIAPDVTEHGGPKGEHVMRPTPTSISCETTNEGTEVLVELVFDLGGEDARQVTVGRRGLSATHMGTQLWKPWLPLEFTLPIEVFDQGQTVELALALHGYRPEAPEWEKEDWAWRQVFGGALVDGKPVLSPVG